MMIGGYSDLALQYPLHGYQDFAATWSLDTTFVKRNKGAAVFLDPGLGKSRIGLTIIDFLLSIGEIKKALIVSTLRPVYVVWPDEIETWGFPHSWSILHGRKTAKMLQQDCKIEITNYESLKKLSDLSGRWDLVWFDESSMAKTWKAARSRYSRKISKRARKSFIATGTPAAQSLADLHAQMYLVDDGKRLGDNVTKFRNQFMVRGGYQGRQWLLREEREDDIRDLISDVSLTMKAEDYLDMPKLVINDIWCQLTPAVAKQYQQLKQELAVELATRDIVCESQSEVYTKCKQLSNGRMYWRDEKENRHSEEVHNIKLEALQDLMSELGGKPVLILYEFEHDLKAMQRLPILRDCPVMSDKTMDLKATMKKWNEGRYLAFLCQWKSASHGLNMQKACNDVATFGMTDSTETWDQAYRRVYRQGVSGEQVRVHRILMKDTVDEIQVERVDNNLTTQNEFLKLLKKHATS